jgi:hypothetical protein
VDTDQGIAEQTSARGASKPFQGLSNFSKEIPSFSKEIPNFSFDRFVGFQWLVQRNKEMRPSPHSWSTGAAPRRAATPQRSIEEKDNAASGVREEIVVARARRAQSSRSLTFVERASARRGRAMRRVVDPMTFLLVGEAIPGPVINSI